MKSTLSIAIVLNVSLYYNNTKTEYIIWIMTNTVIDTQMIIYIYII